MSFDDEWAQHVAAASEKQSVQMQLNRIPDAPTAAAGDLAADQTDLAAVGDAAYTVYQRLSRDGHHADDATRSAGHSLTGFALGPAMGTLAVEWMTQVSSVLGACAQISNHLDYTNKVHARDEENIATSFSVGQLQAGFNERTQLQ